MADKNPHKHDIKVFWRGARALTEAVAMFGFESYKFEQGAAGSRMQKRIIENVPLMFRPLPEFIEDGMLFAWLSDTPNNRKALAEVLKGDTIALADDTILQALSAPVAPPVVVDMTDADREALYKMPKSQLIAMANDMGKSPQGTWTIKKLVTEISGRPDAPAKK